MKTFVCFGVAAAYQLIRDPLPFDCFTENGKEYVGLHTSAASGRKCEHWTKSPMATGKGLGNHNYCRNPDGSMEKPWCYVIGTSTKEACEIPVCKESTLHPKKWIAPSKTGEPCSYEPPARVGYQKLSDKACHKGYGDKQWLIGFPKLHEAADLDACTQFCKEQPGAEFMTLFGTADDDGGNCGCFRDACIQEEGPGEDKAITTLNSPVSYKLGSFPV